MSPDDIEQKLDEKEKQLSDLSQSLDQLSATDSAPQPIALDIEQSTGDPLPQPQSWKQRVRTMLRRPKFWVLCALGLAALSVALWFIRPSRWFLVNLVGLRTTLTITTVVPTSGQQPAQLQGATVLVNGQRYTSNQHGTVTITNQAYGAIKITASKQGYQSALYTAELDFDPFFHRFGGAQADAAARTVQLSLTSVGIPVSFKAVDWLSGTPVTDGDYAVGDMKVKADSNGLVSFRAPPSGSGTVTIRSELGGLFTDKTFTVPLDGRASPTIVFVPAGKDYFMSKRDGALGIYSSNLDGTGVQQLIPGTGKESDSTTFTTSPDGAYGVLVSTRDGVTDENGLVQPRMYIVDLNKKILTQIDQAAFFQLADWSGDKLVYYRPTGTGGTATLRVVDVANGKVTTLATASSFARMVVALNQVAFVALQSGGGSQETASLAMADLGNASTKQLASSINQYTLVQSSFDTLDFQTAGNQAWHELNMNTGALNDASAPTADASQAFLGSPSADGGKHLMITRVDGKFTLTFTLGATGPQKVLYASSDMTGPLRWAGDTVVYRINSSNETADYVVSTRGGAPKKISDVTATVPDASVPIVSTQFIFY